MWVRVSFSYLIAVSSFWYPWSCFCITSRKQNLLIHWYLRRLKCYINYLSNRLAECAWSQWVNQQQQQKQQARLHQFEEKLARWTFIDWCICCVDDRKAWFCIFSALALQEHKTDMPIFMLVSDLLFFFLFLLQNYFVTSGCS